jgi:CHAT domain-containing protein
LSDCDVAHLGVHCLVREKSPWLAALILSGGRKSEGGTGSDDGALTLDEIYKIDLPRTRLVVLSACETALGQYYRGEGIVSIVRPLISARVPEVVASLWSVDSSATADLMIEFHRQRKLSFGRTGEALRRAQMKMISSGHHPFYWSPFIAIGSAR